MNYKEDCFDFSYKDNWLETPLYYNNYNKVIRFDLESKFETESACFIKNIFNDLFCCSDKLLVRITDYHSRDQRYIKKYFKFNSLKKIMKTSIETKYSDYIGEMIKVMFFETNYINFKLETFLADYLNDNVQRGCFFVNLRKKIAVDFYDNRGFDVLLEHKEILKSLYEKYNNFIIEFNRSQIEEFLYNEPNQINIIE